MPRYDWPIYIVQNGDSLSSIARRIDSTPDSLRLANCLTSDYIYAGQKSLCAATACGDVHTDADSHTQPVAEIGTWSDQLLGRCI